MAQAGSLLTETRRLLKERNQKLMDIQAATGISFFWLRRFNSGEIQEPGVNRIQTLYEYLSGRKLLPDLQG
jgi:hypothetical protein